MSYSTNSFDNKIIELIKKGAVGLLPTDTIYGLSAAALNIKAIEKVRNLKGRDVNKPFIVIIASVSQLEQLGIKKDQAAATLKYWPAPLSIIFESRDIPTWLQQGTSSLAVRMPDDDELQDLIRKTGPIVSTSANLQGQEPAQNVGKAKNYFGRKLDFYVDKGDLSGEPSTLAKLEGQNLKIIRQGCYKIKT